jgi:hypothetical protein
MRDVVVENEKNSAAEGRGERWNGSVVRTGIGNRDG